MPGLGFPFRDRAGTQSLVPESETPDPPCNRFLAWFTPTFAEDPDQDARLLKLNVTGYPTIEAEETVGGNYEELRRMTRDGDGVIAIPPFSSTAARRYDLGLALDWSFATPVSGEPPYDAVSDGGGNNYLTYKSSGNARIYKVDSAGSGALFKEITAASLNMTTALPESIALTPDGAVLVVLVVDVGSNDSVQLVGVEVSTGNVLWTLELDDTATEQAYSYHLASVRFAGEALYASYLKSNGTHDHPLVARLIFASDFDSAPTVAWSRQPTAAYSGNHIPLTAMAAHSDGVLVGYKANDAGGGNPHVLTAYDADGNVAWQLSDSNFTLELSGVYQHGMDVGDGVVLVGLHTDYERFPNEGYGFAAFDVSDGSEDTAGALSIEQTLAGQVVNVTSLTSVEVLTTWDGLSLTTWDGETLTTWEDENGQPCDGGGGLIIV